MLKPDHRRTFKHRDQHDERPTPAVPATPPTLPLNQLFDPYRRLTIFYTETQPYEIPSMPRSKFATKAYGPTKPKICQDQQLPPGLLPPGPGKNNSAHFLLVVTDTGGIVQPVAGTANLSRSAFPDQYNGFVQLGEYGVALGLNASPAAFLPFVFWTITKGSTFITSGSVYGPAPRSIDPYDTGIIEIGPRTTWGQQMIRIVARD